MIKKIEINNVGRFRSFRTSGDEVYFKKHTFIYGKNTFGKSTLTAILRSLKENNPDYVLGRKTIGAVNQSVKIIPDINIPIGEYRYTTGESVWNHQYDGMAIFDGYFVRESIYTQSQQIGREQERNIEAFMLGSKGLKYSKEISDLTDQINENAKTQKALFLDYEKSKHLLGDLPFKKFLALNNDIATIGVEAKKIGEEIDIIKNSNTISRKLEMVKKLLEKYALFDPSSISGKISVKSELIANHFLCHINQDESRQTYSSFLQIGSRLRDRKEDEYCPFCTQKIQNNLVKNFLETVDTLYNESYRTLQQSINSADNLFSEESNAAFFSDINQIKIDLSQLNYTLGADLSSLVILFEACSQSVKDKKEDLSKDLDMTSFDGISKILSVAINNISVELVKFKNSSQLKTDLNNLQNRLDIIHAALERSGSWKLGCEKYIKAQKENRLLAAQKVRLWKEYLVYAKNLSGTMFSTINTILNACNCSFIVQNFEFQGNQQQPLFTLKMNNSQISNHGAEDELTIKNSLSDSDKWILALAFFITTIKNDDAIKTVVMDDPVSSFDTDRRRVILKEIMKIFADNSKQLILLTHEIGFYQLIHAENKSDNMAVFLRVSLYDDGSRLIACDPNNDSDFLSPYNGWIASMKNAINSHDLNLVKNAHSNIRLVIECIIKSKYPLEITGEIKTISDMLGKLEQPNGPYGSSNSPRSSINQILINATHHDNSGLEQYPSDILGIDDYKKDIKDTFELIKIL